MLAINDWKAFYQSLSLDIGYGIPVPHPSAEQLDSFEAAVGFPLPKTYREFVLVFGPGEFRVTLRISSPGCLLALDSSYDLAAAHAGYGLKEDDIREYFSENMHAILRRLYYFGYLDEKDWLAWDLGDVRDAADREYAIYRVSYRHVKLIATSFKELVEAVCDDLFAPDPDWDEEERGPQRSFGPATYDPDAS